MGTTLGDIRSGASRGVVGAMAMSGVRELTREAGFLRQSPPDQVAEGQLRGLFDAVPDRFRDAAIELAHWGFGAGAGAFFGAVPRRLRSRTWLGVAYGVAIYAAYDAGASRLLGVSRRKEPLSQRLALAADHVLFGLVVTDRSARTPA
jgi:hypothetical protein